MASLCVEFRHSTSGVWQPVVNESSDDETHVPHRYQRYRAPWRSNIFFSFWPQSVTSRPVHLFPENAPRTSLGTAVQALFSEVKKRGFARKTTRRAVQQQQQCADTHTNGVQVQERCIDFFPHASATPPLAGLEKTFLAFSQDALDLYRQKKPRRAAAFWRWKNDPELKERSKSRARPRDSNGRFQGGT